MSQEPPDGGGLAEVPIMSRTVQTLRQVAEAFQVNKRTVSRWLERGCPGKPGAYDLEEIDDWKRLHQREHRDKATLAGRAPGQTPRQTAEVEELRRRKLNADARIKTAVAELKEYRARLATDDSLIRQEDAERFISHFLTQARRLLEKTEHPIVATVPRRHQERLREVVRDAHRDLLVGMHQFIGEIAEVR